MSREFSPGDLVTLSPGPLGLGMEPSGRGLYGDGFVGLSGVLMLGELAVVLEIEKSTSEPVGFPFWMKVISPSGAVGWIPSWAVISPAPSWSSLL